LRESGEKYVRMRALVHQTRPDLPARCLVVMRISAIYQCMPSAGEGERIG
jgi:predicted pyridoxine 5'-phosphate oxidase superfamily flavin-nucleotide-binding protein